MSDPIPFEDPWDGNAECRFCDEQAMHRGDCPWLLRLLAERDAQAEQIAQIPGEIETALKEFDGLRVIHTQAPEHPEGVIGSYLERSDVLHVLVHLRAKIRAILDAAGEK